MALHGLFPLLDHLPAWRRTREELAGPTASVRLAVPPSPRSFLLAALAGQALHPEHNLPGTTGPGGRSGKDQRRALVLLTPRPEDAHRRAEELAVYLGTGVGPADQQEGPLEAPQVLLFPAGEALPFERLDVDQDVVQGRLRVLATLTQPGRALVVVTSVAALLQRTAAHQPFLEACHTLRVGQQVQVTSLLSRWTAMGYSVEPAVELPGAASRRGGILDIYPTQATLPARIELWGDTIESIRLFDPLTQRSLQQIESIQIIPARETDPAQDPSPSTRTPGARTRGESAFSPRLFSSGSLLDHLPDSGILVLDEPQSLSRAGEELQESEAALRHTKEARGELPKLFPSPNWSWTETEQRIGQVPRQLHLEWLGLTTHGETDLGFTPAPSSWGRLEHFASGVREQARKGARVVLLSPSAQRLQEILRDNDVGSRPLPALDSPPAPASVSLVPASLDEGFALALPSGPLLLLTDTEVFGRAKRRRPIRRRGIRREVFLSELTPGSYVVHVDHGVGRFVGTRQVEAEHGAREFLTLEYAEGDRLYLPPEHLDRLSPYVAPGDTPPSLTRLGTQEWSRAKERARSSAREMARELLDLYAARQVLPGFAFSPDTPWQRELEEAFPYQETSDQQQTLAEVKADMEEPHPLDRLVCGDVGYGKTEIALRAAFKAIQDGKQVALLCPTTILAQQHYATFTERLGPFPTRVEVLSRFRTDEEQRTVVQGLRSGAVDVVIGTHRLVQKDVAFKDLGLLVIDDEQRFGVAHKERFKQLRREVDVLTMTATPIPRTLYMAMSGIRDMSTIETPPETRQPVRTFVAAYSDDLVQEAVRRELDRGGQLFFLHNRVRDIHEWAHRLQELVPQARVAIGHGQMDEVELAAVMADFGQAKIDLLVCTTIIEAGLDLPNANTLIVHRPELLGLAQMYQLRGRVGRGSRRAYAYFLTPRGRRITDAAEKRLQALLAHQELGSGFRIAMKDLEIRGAGNLLGAEQSGHIHAIGFDLYVRLLEEAVADLRQQTGGAPRPEPPPQATVSLPLEAHIPDDYVSDLTQRLGIYQRLARATALEEVESLRVELQDRFGVVPEPVVNLLYTLQVRLLAGAAGVESLAREGDHIALRLREPTGGAKPALQTTLGPVVQVGDRLIRLRMADHWLQELPQALERLAAFRQRLLALVGG